MGGDDKAHHKTTTTIEMEHLSLNMSPNAPSRDLLQRFMGSGSSNLGGGENAAAEIELNLGLSLGGRFGVDTNKLVRSSSVATFLPVARDDSDPVGPTRGPTGSGYGNLVRTSSLPAESEEEWRKRKEMQSLRRMEAKRRSEKQRSLRAGGEMERTVGGLRRTGSTAGAQFGGPTWTAAVAGRGKGSQGSVESKGGSSSSDLESKAMQGSSGELSPASIQSLQEVGNQDVGSSATKSRENTTRPDSESATKRTDAPRARGKEIGKNSLEDMPCVFTKGDGPFGRRVDGILYKYGKGEDVRIMCVCHGTFHSPAEFVRHAGGTDVENPLKHIVVNPNFATLT